MYVPHPVFLDPKIGSIKLWRYIDFTKLESLIQRKQLYFCSVDKLEDTYEGTFPLKEIEYQKKLGNWEEISSHHKKNRNNIYVNCWHYNENESISMWSQYSQIGKGIAIQSTIPRLKQSLKDCIEHINIGMVQYIDYDIETFYHGNRNGYPYLTIGTPYIHKRKIYDSEREYRAIKLLPNSKVENQFYVPVDLEILMESIIVAPKSTASFLESVQSLLKEHLLDKNVIHSIYDKPPFH